jgi:protein-disulfide isomerase
MAMLVRPVLRARHPGARPTGPSRELDLKRTEAATLTRNQRRQRERHERAARTGREGSVAPWRQPMILITGAAFVFGLVLVVAINLSSPGQPKTPAGAALAAPSNDLQAGQADGAALGSASAPVQILIYSDYQCPICGRLARELLPRLIADFVAAGKVRIEDRAIAFLGSSEPDESLDAAAGAECAGAQNRYWQYHGLLFWNQAGENKGAFSRDRLAAMATASELDVPAWQACFNGSTVRTSVQDATSTALRAGINATPTIVINGQKIVGLPASYGDLAVYIRNLISAPRPAASPSG